MRGRFIHQAVLAIMFLCQLSICLATETPDTNDSSKYLNAVREFADNVLKHGRDTYGPKHTPLFVDGLNIHTHGPVKWIDPDGTKWILSNFASQQTLMRTLDGLSRITGDSKYRRAAMRTTKYVFEHVKSPNGLIHWGHAAAYDASADKVWGKSHVFKLHYPYYELMWEVNPNATKKFIEAFWSAHIIDWSNLDMCRIGYQDRNLEEPWNHQYIRGPTFFKSKRPWGRAFLHTGSSLVQAGTVLYRFSGQEQPLVWSKRLAHRYVRTRHPKTGIGALLYNGPWHQLGEDLKEHFSDPYTTLFPYNPFETRFLYWPENAQAQPWICMFLVGEMLGEQHREFTQWALEELNAWGNASYRTRDNAFIPMLTDGTSIEGYVCKEHLPLGPKGTVIKPYFADLTFFWAYALAYRATADRFMWEMTRHIALGNSFGDIGVSPEDIPQLRIDTSCSGVYGLLGFLELYAKTGKPQFLQIACRIGDNIVDNQFYKGFFVLSKRHIYTRFDCFEPLALLHLHAVMRSQTNAVPQVWPNSPLFVPPYRHKEHGIDRRYIYALSEFPEPPLSLQEAAALGNINLVRSFIEKGTEVDGREDGFLKTALHWAAMFGRKEVAELLLKKGADVSARDNYPFATPLHYASEKGHKEIAELLIARGADINATRGYPAGDTPLHSAVRAGHKEIVELLIANGADVNAKNNNGQTPVDAALSRNRNEVVKLLVAKGADISLHAASRFGDLAIVKSLIEEMADINAKDTSGQTPLHYAAEYGHKDVVELFITNGANVNAKDKDGNTPGHVALDENNRSMLELLIAKGANFTSIHLSAYQGDLDEVRSFIDKGVDVNAKSKSGQTPLHKAAIRGHKDVVELLIDNAANVNATDQVNYTPLYCAVWSWDTETAELLIEKGADVNAKDRWGWTPLHYAASRDNRGMAQLLIVKGADMNAKDNSGETALSVAKEKGHTVIVELLCKHGAEKASKGEARKTERFNNVADLVATGEVENNRFGVNVTVGNVNGDGYNDLLVTAPGYNKRQGRAYLYYGGENVDDKADKIFTGENIGDGFSSGGGPSVYLADMNKDGFDDVIIGARKLDNAKGRVYIFWGGPKMDVDPDIIIEGQVTDSQFGHSLAVGDLNGDGELDLIVGANKYEEYKGRAYLYYGPIASDTVVDKIFTGEDTDDTFAMTMNARGDVNGDGFDDLLVGTLYYPRNTHRGRAYLYYGGAGTGMDVDADLIFTGENDRDDFAVGIDLFDIDDDGYADVLITARKWPSGGLQGRAYLYWGSSRVTMDNVADKIFTGKAGVKGELGGNVIYGGNVNDDNYGDIYIASYGYLNSDHRGRGYLYYGNTKVSMDTVCDHTFTEGEVNSSYGKEAKLADLNDDGLDDVIVGAWRYNNYQGRVYVYFNKSLPPKSRRDTATVGELE